MFVVRYIALAALVVWLGAMLGALLENRTTYFTSIAYGCGALVVVALIALKFVGPPPRAAFTRIGIVLLMLLVTLIDRWLVSGPAPMYINAALGFTLLAFYAHE